MGNLPAGVPLAWVWSLTPARAWSVTIDGSAVASMCKTQRTRPRHYLRGTRVRGVILGVNQTHAVVDYGATVPGYVAFHPRRSDGRPRGAQW